MKYCTSTGAAILLSAPKFLETTLGKSLPLLSKFMVRLVRVYRVRLKEEIFVTLCDANIRDEGYKGCGIFLS